MRDEGKTNIHGRTSAITSLCPRPCLEKVLYLSGRVTRPVGKPQDPLVGSPAQLHFSLAPHPFPLPKKLELAT
jgi:hypothetical protein